MNVMQIGILLEIIGTLIITFVAGLILAPEVIGSKIPTNITDTLKKVAYKLHNLVPEQVGSQIKGLKKGLIAPIFWVLTGISISSFILTNHLKWPLLFSIIGIVASVLAIFLFG